MLEMLRHLSHPIEYMEVPVRSHDSSNIFYEVANSYEFI